MRESRVAECRCSTRSSNPRPHYSIGAIQRVRTQWQNLPSSIWDREKPHGSPLPHHRTNGSRIRRFGRLSQCAKHTVPARQPERHLQPRQRRFHPSHRACAPWTRRMQYRCSLASDFSSLSIPSRGTVRAFSGCAT